MRDIVLLAAMLGFVPLCLRYPAAGAICWAWVSIMNPHRQVYGFALGLQFNLMIAAATLLGWLLSAERKRWTPDFMPKLMLIFVLWMTFNSCFAAVPTWSWDYWDRTMRGLALVFLVFFIADTKARVHGLVWIIVLSLGYYSLKGGIFTVIHGGHYTVFGPAASILGDNNQLALAVVMSLPLMNYLRMHTRSRGIQLGLTVAMFLGIVMVLGSKSRGGAIALVITLTVFWLSTRHKLIYAIVGSALLLMALSVMPDSYFNRLDTINEADQDSSFMSRVTAWKIAIAIAIDRFPFGAGFYAQQLPSISHAYFPAEGALPSGGAYAAHSIYFQVLGEHGFVGLAIYLAILLLALYNTFVVARQTRTTLEFRWAYDLAVMTRTALIGYYVGGAALSVAYFDGFFVLIALLSTVRELTASGYATGARPAASILPQMGPSTDTDRPTIRSP